MLSHNSPILTHWPHIIHKASVIGVGALVPYVLLAVIRLKVLAGAI